MLRYLLAVWLAFAGVAHADYLTVTGSGSTFQSAKESAFRKAIEFKVGVTVLSDLEVQNYKLVKQEIYLYSAGFVDDYQVLSQENTPDGVIVLMKVAVAENKLKNRILSVGKTTSEFSGDRHAVQLATSLQEKQQAERLLDKTLSDYPVKAFKIKHSAYSIELNVQRQALINVPYELTWNFDFLVSLRETLETINDCTPRWASGCNYKVTVIAKDPKDLVFVKTTTSYFSDVGKNNQVHNRFVNGSPVIIVKLYDANNVNFHSICQTPRFIWGGNEGFYSTGRENVAVIYGNALEKGTIGFTAPLTVIDKITKIELSVESKDRCR